MKIRFPILLLLLVMGFLTGCITVYSPVLEPATDDYYLAQDSQVSDGIYYGSGSVQYSDMGVYPWWSVDYFYLAYQPYSQWRYSYYSPYFYPHYFSMYFSPWHWNHPNRYGAYYSWNDPYWHNRYRHHNRSYSAHHRSSLRHRQPVQSGSGHRQRDNRHSEPVQTGRRYTGGSRPGPGPRGRVNEQSQERETMSRIRTARRSPENPVHQRSVQVRPKSQKNHLVRLDPVRSTGMKAVVRPASATAAPVYHAAPARSLPGRHEPRRSGATDARKTVPVQIRSGTTVARKTVPVQSRSNRTVAVSLRATGRPVAAGRSRDRSSSKRKR